MASGIAQERNVVNTVVSVRVSYNVTNSMPEWPLGSEKWLCFIEFDALFSGATAMFIAYGS